MRNSKAKNINDSLGNYYASSMAHAIINHNNKDNKNISQDLESICGVQGQISYNRWRIKKRT